MGKPVTFGGRVEFCRWHCPITILAAVSGPVSKFVGVGKVNQTAKLEFIDQFAEDSLGTSTG